MSLFDKFHDAKRKEAHREGFLCEMAKVVPSSALESVIDPRCFRAGNGVVPSRWSPPYECSRFSSEVHRQI